MNLDQLIKEITKQEPDAGEMEQAAARVRSRLFPGAAEAPGAAATGTIRSCADFAALIPAYIAGTLDSGRKLLLEVHTRECVGCRASLRQARTGARQVVEFKPRKVAGIHYSRWAIAASALLVAGSAAWWASDQYPAMGGGPRATVDSVDGALYKVSGAALTPLAPGAELAENDTVRTAKNSTAVLHLNDGSKVEMNQRAQIAVTRSWSGSTIHLGLGNIIVKAAKQRSGSLRVAAPDCNVSVKGTIFSVDAGIRGSRVTVVEGTVWVDHGTKHDVLHRGDETATSAEMGKVPVRQEFEWSQNSSEYLALLGEFGELRKQIAAIPSPGLRYESKLLGYLPADVGAVAAIPNLGGTLAQASQIFRERVSQSEALAAWWKQVPAASRTGFETTIQQLQTASGYLGDEIVIAGAFGRDRQASPLILAQLTHPGLDTYLKGQLPASVFDGHMRFDNGLFIAASSTADLNLIAPSAGFLQTPLFARLAPAYQRGAGWLFGADLAQVNADRSLPGDARFLTAESRSMGARTENRASLAFSKDRSGVASWLAAPGPMGSLDFVSPDAGFAASMLLKNPALIVEDLGSVTPVQQAMLQQPMGIDLKAEMASAFAGEITIALDGPLLPVPSWKIAAEVYYPDRLQASFLKLTAAFNAEGTHEKTGALKLTESDVDGRTFYKLQFEKLPWEADWTFVDGYWVAAANRELLVRSIQNRQTGYTLARSNAFRAQLPQDATTNFSAVIYHNLGQTLAPLLGMFNNVKGMETLKQPDTPGVICFWAAPDRIDAAALGSVFGMKIESLIALDGPMQLLKGSVGVNDGTGAAR